MEKPVPDKVPLLTVTGAVPLAVSVTGCVAGVLRETFPKAMLLPLTERVAT